MKETNIVFELNFIFIVKNIFLNKEFYYVKKNLLLNFLPIIFLKKYKKIDWKLIGLEKNNEKILTQIIENDDVGKFVYNFLDYSNFIEIENNPHFFNYTVKYLSNSQNIIGSMSIRHFIIFLESISSVYTGKINIVLPSTEFNKFIINNYQKADNLFFFNNNFEFLNLFKNYFSIINKIIYIFFTKPNLSLNKSLAVMDSYQINSPKSFFSEKDFYDKSIFLTNTKQKDNSIFNIYRFVRLSFFFNFFFNLLKRIKFLTKQKILFFLYLKFNFEKDIFLEIFKSNKIKKFFSSHIAQPFVSSANAAIEELEGVSIGFTISFSQNYSCHQNIDAFNYFLSFNNCNYIKKKNTKLKEIKKFGYIGDYKFLIKKSESDDLKLKLKNLGCKYIIGFFDQGSTDDYFFDIGHEKSREGYKFLLNKVLENEHLGLIIKPKKPKLLKNKLSDVYDLLSKAKETKRCIVFDNYEKNHVKNFEDIPAKIAMASDITIHDTLLAGTAGLESALTGNKSVFFDYYHSTKSHFLSKDLNIVFNDWNYLWIEILKDQNKENKNLGNWNNIIDQFDIFRDGKANLRIMNFLKKI
jgi:hypothetical protein